MADGKGASRLGLKFAFSKYLNHLRFPAQRMLYLEAAFTKNK